MSVYIVTRRPVRSTTGVCGWELSAWKLTGGEQTAYSVIWTTEEGTFGMVGTERTPEAPPLWTEAHKLILEAHPELHKERWQARGAMLYCHSTEAAALFMARDAAKAALHEAEWALARPREVRFETKD